MATYIDGMEGGKHNSDETEVRSRSNFEINISGEGTKKEIIKALEQVLNSLREVSSEDEDAILDGVEWEDATLMTTIKAV